MVAYLLRLMKEIGVVLMAFGIEFFLCVCQFVCSHFSHVNKVAVLAILRLTVNKVIYLAFLDLYIQLVIASFFFYTSDFLSNKGPVLEVDQPCNIFLLVLQVQSVSLGSLCSCEN